MAVRFGKMSSVSVGRIETEIKKIFASYSTFPGIQKWGQNDMNDWWHPITRNQRETLADVNKGDKINFIYISKDERPLTIPVKVVDVGSPLKYMLLAQLYGHPAVPDWNFADCIRVRKI